MTRLTTLMTEHPAAVGETYSEHFRFASGIGFKLIGAGCAAMVHALLPFLFERTASTIIAGLASRTNPRREMAASGKTVTAG